MAVAPERLAAFLDRFAERHGPFSAALHGDRLAVSSPDGAVAEITVPFPPPEPVLPEPVSPERAPPEPVPPGPVSSDLVAAVLAHVLRDRVVGAVAVRRGGYAVGVFRGRTLLDSKVGSLRVQGQTKAGGWSQQRYARRREQQARQAYAAAADAAVRVLLPRLAELEAVVTGGDRAGVAAVMHDPRLGEVAARAWPRTFPLPDPRLRVLQAFPDQFLALDVALNALATDR